MERVVAVVDNRWLSIGAGLCVMAASGTQYMFSSYSSQVKALMEYDQSEVNFIGSMANVGVYIGFWTGFVHDKWGARVTAASSAALLFLGWLGFYLGLVQVLPTNYLVMGFFMFVAGNGSAAGYTAALANNIQKFQPQHRGKVVGLLVSLFGLSAAIFTQVYTWVFQSDVEAFVLFFVLALPFLAIIGFVFLAPPPVTLAAEDAREGEVDGKESDKLLAKGDLVAVEEGLPLSELPAGEEGEEEGGGGHHGGSGTSVRQANVLQALKTVDFWIFNTLFFFLSGIGLVMFNNLGPMVLSAGGADGQQNPLVTLLSLVNAASRLIVGYTSDVFLKKQIMSRLTLLLLTQTMMAASQVYFGVITAGFLQQPVAWFYPGVLILGFAYGSLFSLSPCITCGLFGPKYFGSLWSVLGLAPAFGSLIFSTGLAGHVYDYYANPDTNDCYGWSCYGITLITGTVLCSCALVLLAYLAYRWHQYMNGSKTPS